MIQCAVVLVNKSQVYTKGVETFIGDISLELLARWHIKQLGISCWQMVTLIAVLYV